MPYFTRIFSPTDAVPPLDSIRMLAAQYAADVRTLDEESDWETAELVYNDEQPPVDLERYLPASDGLFEEDIADFRSTLESYDSEEATRVLSALEECRQIVSFRVPDDADDAVWEPLNAAIDAVTGAIGGLCHADAEGFYEDRELILPMD